MCGRLHEEDFKLRIFNDDASKAIPFFGDFMRASKRDDEGCHDEAKRDDEEEATTEESPRPALMQREERAHRVPEAQQLCY